MNVRPFQPEDEPFLRKLDKHEDFPSNIGEFLVVVDDCGMIQAAAGARLVPEIILMCGEERHPLVRLKEMALLHQALMDKLSAGNHTEAHAILPPQMKAFGRHLVKHFGWIASQAIAIRIERP